MNQGGLRRHSGANAAQAALLLLTMMLLAGGLAWLLGGPLLLLVAVGLVGLSFLGAGRLAPAVILRAYRARPITAAEAPQLAEVVRTLARRADLPRTPELWYLPSDVMNAFAVGLPDRSAIALSDGVLRRLSLREVAAVLAHETSHIAHLDTRLLGFADVTTRVTSRVSQLGLLLAVVTLPMQLMGLARFPLLLVALLLAAPLLSTLAQLALSRTREFDADLRAARLLGDPRPLASALHKMEVWNGSVLQRLRHLLPGGRLPEPSLLRSHPPTHERIERLLNLASPNRPARVPWPATPTPRDLVAREPIRPRWHRTTTWF